MGKNEQRLRELGIEIPAPPLPQASYLPAVKANGFVQTSGQLPLQDGKLVYQGKVGKDLTVEEGAAAARLCCLNCLAAIRNLLGSLDLIEQIVMVRGYVNSAPDFSGQALVLEGASKLLIEIFGDSGKHARLAVGVSDLPGGAAVELELLVKATSP